jgi:hypothetical protein
MKAQDTTATSDEHWERVRRAEEALSSNPNYISGDGDAQTWVVDVVADLLTWAESRGVESYDVTRIALRHVEAEWLERRATKEGN